MTAEERGWWQAEARTPPWWQRWRKRPPHVERALRRRFPPLRSAPAQTSGIPAPIAVPASWLLRGQGASAGDARSVFIGPEKATAPDIGRPGAQRGAAGVRLAHPAGLTVATGPSLTDLLRAVLAPPIDRLLPGPEAILEWPGELFPYQQEGVLVLLGRERVLLADDMGLGKTVQVAAAMRLLVIRREVESVLLLAPASLIDQWRRELERWAPELRVMPIRGGADQRAWQWRSPAHVYVVSYETFRNDAGEASGAPRKKTWDLVVLDEAQKVKNRDTDTARLVKRLLRRRSWALTGTPLETSLDDLASLLEFVDHTDDGSPRHYAPGPALLARLQELQLRRRKMDVLTDLPAKQVTTLGIELSPRQRATYDLAEHEGIVHLRSLGSVIRIQHVLELILRLKQICNADPGSGESAKLDDIAERLHTLSAEGNRALIFSQFTDADYGVRMAARELADFDPLAYVGDLTPTERDRVIQQFRSQPRHRVLILSLRAGGVGLNLQEASYVFHLDRWWNPATERQAEDRSHRIGQTVPVTVFKYTSVDTIEERIEQVLRERQQLFDDVVDDVSTDLGSRLSEDELFGLFKLEKPEKGSAGEPRNGSGLALEARCEAILRKRGWAVARTPRSHDGGIDLVATRVDEVGIESTIFVQCKDYARTVGVEAVRAFIGALPVDGRGDAVFAAPEGLTADAAELAQKRGVRVWDREALARLEAE